jgi:ADP-L-glycero-D-manno-heptose 6-epimerase
MASMVYHGYKQQKDSGVIKLFKSCNPKYPDGGQLRDFVYVKDVCRVIVYFMEHPEHSGLFNVGTGRAQSFEELISAVFHALNKEVSIKYIDMPEHLKEKYQYYTQADIDKLRKAGYEAEFMDVEVGVRDYVLKHLDKGFEIY